MYCPQCECGVALAPDAGAVKDAFDPALGLVVLVETNDRVQLAMVTGLLEEAGIPFYLLGQIATLVQDVDGFLKKWVRVQVPKDREAEARGLLEQLALAESLPAEEDAGGRRCRRDGLS